MDVILDIINGLYAHGISGKDIDKAVQTYRLIPNQACFNVEIRSLEILGHLIKHSDVPHVFVTNSVFHFSALYKENDYFPIPRIYFLKEKNMLSLKKIYDALGYKVDELPIYSTIEFQALLPENYTEKIRKIRNKAVRNSGPFHSLFNNRVQKTAVEKGIYIHDDKCVVCKSKNLGMSTTTHFSEIGVMTKYPLCNLCIEKAEKFGGIMKYLSQNLNWPVRYSMSEIGVDQLFESSLCVIENKLNCKIIKSSKEKSTIHGLRKSGFKVIFRVNSINDYAYMIQDSSGVDMARFDCADHHQVDWGPDHVHVNLHDKNTNISLSYLYGYPEMDSKSILDCLEKLELSSNLTET